MTEIYFLITSSVFILLTLVLSKNLVQQLWVLFSVVGIIAYAGVGIFLPEVPNYYVLHLVNFILFFLISFLLFSKKQVKDDSELLEKPSLSFLSLEYVSRIGFFIYLFSLVFYLIYPEFRLHYLIFPPNFSITGILHRIEYFDSFSLNYWVRVIGFLFLPFFWVHLYYLNKKRGIAFVILALLLEIYLKALKFEYIGRTDIMMTMLLILVIFLYKNNKKFKMRHFTVIGMIGLLTIPFFVTYIYTRRGASIESLGFVNSIRLFIESELYYPIYYNAINTGKGINVDPLRYIIWLVTLPIPKIFTPNLDIVQVNAFFSIMISGITPDKIEFAYYLPSILGEAFIVWGDMFYWVHAIILGGISGITYSIIVKYKQLHYYAFYLIVRALAMGRGGSQGYISTIINGSLLLIVYIIFVTITRKISTNSIKDA